MNTRARSIATVVRVAARFVLDCVEVSSERLPSRAVIAADCCAPGWCAATLRQVLSLVVVQAAAVSSVAASHSVHSVHVAAPLNLENVPGVYAHPLVVPVVLVHVLA